MVGVSWVNSFNANWSLTTNHLLLVTIIPTIKINSHNKMKIHPIYFYKYIIDRFVQDSSMYVSLTFLFY